MRADDAADLADAYLANRGFLAPWDPVRDEAFFTVEGQRQRLAQAERDRELDTGFGCIIEYEGKIAGTVALTAIQRGPAQFANLGYWVAHSANGRGIATRAVAQMLDIAFRDLDLHRVQAATLLHNGGSQKVLRRNGFEPIGVARAYLKIAGEWQDHILYQRLHDTPGS